MMAPSKVAKLIAYMALLPTEILYNAAAPPWRLFALTLCALLDVSARHLSTPLNRLF